MTFCENLSVLAVGELETMLSDFKALAALREVCSKTCEPLVLGSVSCLKGNVQPGL